MKVLTGVTTEELLQLVPDAKNVGVPDHLQGLGPDDLYPVPHGFNPPLEWLTSLPEGFGPDSPPHIDHQGRIAMVAWPYDRCHIGRPNGKDCWIPTPSPTDPPNQLYHQGSTITAEGIQIPTGGLRVAGGHDQDPISTVKEGQKHYNFPELNRAALRILETPTTAYAVGSLLPGTTVAEAERIRAHALSGDWRRIPELNYAYDVIAPVLVAVPGLPRAYQAAAADDQPVLWTLNRDYQPTPDGKVVASLYWTPETITLEKIAMSNIHTHYPTGFGTVVSGTNATVTNPVVTDQSGRVVSAGSCSCQQQPAQPVQAQPQPQPQAPAPQPAVQPAPAEDPAMAAQLIQSLKDDIRTLTAEIGRLHAANLPASLDVPELPTLSG